jgi:glyoxylase-like metal-dependent hydrolase (beta-lactamase superfamily II)
MSVSTIAPLPEAVSAHQFTAPAVTSFFDAATSTVTYVVHDPETREAVVIDSVLDFDAASGRTTTESADRLLAFVREQGLSVGLILETHVHADHLSAAPHLRQALGARIAIGAEIKTVQSVFGELFNEGPAFRRDGSQFDLLLGDGDTFSIGRIGGIALHTPGHTPACMSYLIGDALFVGDTVFMPDMGSARCDFPGGDARTLFRSIRRLFQLPDEVRIFHCHDYVTPDRDELVWESTVGQQRRENRHVGDGISEDDFVRMRTERDATLSMPTLILPSVQVNMNAGMLPEPEDNGQRYLKIPLNAF